MHPGNLSRESDDTHPRLVPVPKSGRQFGGADEVGYDEDDNETGTSSGYNETTTIDSQYDK